MPLEHPLKLNELLMLELNINVKSSRHLAIKDSVNRAIRNEYVNLNWNRAMLPRLNKITLRNLLTDKLEPKNQGVLYILTRAKNEKVAIFTSPLKKVQRAI